MASLQGARGGAPVGGSSIQPDARAPRSAGRSDTARRERSPVRHGGRQGPGFGILVFILAIVALGLVAVTTLGKIGFAGGPSPADAEKAADAKAQVAAIAAAEGQVRQSLSAATATQFTNVFVKDASIPIVCGYVEAKDHAGKSAGPRAFLVTGTTATIDLAHATAFSRTWNQTCLGLAPEPGEKAATGRRAARPS